MKGPLTCAGEGPVLVPYGVDRLPTSSGWDSPCLNLRSGEVLRLNCEEFDLPPPIVGQEDRPLDQQLADHLKRLAGGWDRSSTGFIDAYFAFLRSVIVNHHHEIEARFAGFAGLFEPADTLYSAPLPLPRALVPLPEDAGAAPRWARVDIMFWLGGQHPCQTARAVLFSPSRLPPKAERLRRESLAAAGVNITVLEPGAEASPGVFEAILGDRAHTFWRDETLPTAPGGPRLPDI